MQDLDIKQQFVNCLEVKKTSKNLTHNLGLVFCRMKRKNFGELCAARHDVFLFFLTLIHAFFIRNLDQAIVLKISEFRMKFCPF